MLASSLDEDFQPMADVPISEPTRMTKIDDMRAPIRPSYELLLAHAGGASSPSARTRRRTRSRGVVILVVAERDRIGMLVDACGCLSI